MKKLLLVLILANCFSISYVFSSNKLIDKINQRIETLENEAKELDKKAISFDQAGKTRDAMKARVQAKQDRDLALDLKNQLAQALGAGK